MVVTTIAFSHFNRLALTEVPLGCGNEGVGETILASFNGELKVARNAREFGEGARSI